jgi:hypothetical protein
MMVDADFRLAESERIIAESRHSDSIQNLGTLHPNGRRFNEELSPAGIAK